MNVEPLPDDGKFEVSRQQTIVPGVLLLVCGCLNALLSLYLIYSGIQVMTLSEEEFDELVIAPNIARNPKLAEVLSNRSTVAMVRFWSGPGSLGIGVVSLLAAVPICLAGIGMIRLRWFGLSVAGSILAVIPCLSCTSCCGFGELAGIWALVVLFNPEVRSTFRQVRLQRGVGNETTP
jgi:hypothetical protein